MTMPQPTPTMPRTPDRSERELDEWLEVLNPPPAAVSQAEAKFALTLRRLAADAAVELLVHELEEVPA